ncbi:MULTISPECIES: septal ring lytic transglycosylase RlpA family protein [Halomonadaceae]|uniref:Endolytic peptidoglycan transglycosylase RlpA n=1 Tax=Vreelandella malpeensis TaxID=1172368 RepID=A0ABS8DNL9_9GAMM|nr:MULTISPECIES: septal ring lytic transglycosylase RlpA family protein [Halomonas]MCB8887876.1 septal ring lytic transglycosylase RlpA family protein [Halomonas malpeensis]MCP1315939.1 septal ring lytic transglycosylase RlpA family protein [Halomonas sp. 707D7]MCP1326355.1 septal ring lytic transglycosylase RlpA family protein [Halomonas sp. 707D4]
MGAYGRRIKTSMFAVLLSVVSTGVFAQETDFQEGVASFYSDRFQGATTASGEAFDQQALTAAHPSLPFGSKVLVTRPDTGQEVEVLINDRGPFVKGRIIDLSKSAARQLGMVRRGTAPVMLTLIN